MVSITQKIEFSFIGLVWTVTDYIHKVLIKGNVNFYDSVITEGRAFDYCRTIHNKYHNMRGTNKKSVWTNDIHLNDINKNLYDWWINSKNSFPKIMNGVLEETQKIMF